MKASSRGAARGDLDGDGDEDIVINNIDAAPTVLENRAPPRYWLRVQLSAKSDNRQGIGARVIYEEGEFRQSRRLRGGDSYASQSELVARFVRQIPAITARIVVRWPDGQPEIFPVPPAETIGVQALVLRQGEGSSGE